MAMHATTLKWQRLRWIVPSLATVVAAYLLGVRARKHQHTAANARQQTAQRRALERQFNKHILNPVTLKVAGHRRSPYGIIYHFGRHSGQPHATPVVMHRLGNSLIAPLPYGTDVDWLHNVQAAGRCHVKWQGRIYDAGAPEVVSPEEGLPAFGARQQALYRRLGFTHYLKLPVPPEEFAASA